MNGDQHTIGKGMGRLAMAIAVTIAGSQAEVAFAARENCQYHSANIIASKATLLPTPPGYDFCASAPVTGTLNGTSTTCQLSNSFIPFGNIFGTGDDGYFTIAYVDTFETKDGTITIHEYDVFNGSIGIGMMKIVGGTGKFAGATGTLIYTPVMQNYDNGLYFGDLPLTGVICSDAS